MTRSRWIFVIIAAIVVLGGLIALAGRRDIDVSKINPHQIIKANTMAGTANIAIGDHVFGNQSGKVLLVEYGDLECPSCGALHPVLRPLLNYYKDSLSFVFRNFPLTSIHPNALAAATAAEAAGLQGKYWDMNDLLYNDQNSWVNDSAAARTAAFKGYAGNLSLNVNKFTADITNNTDIQTKIKFDQALGDKLGVHATPTLYLQGKEIATERDKAVQGDATALETAIRNAIKAAGLSLPDQTYADAQKAAQQGQ